MHSFLGKMVIIWLQWLFYLPAAPPHFANYQMCDYFSDNCNVTLKQSWRPGLMSKAGTTSLLMLTKCTSHMKSTGNTRRIRWLAQHLLGFGDSIGEKPPPRLNTKTACPVEHKLSRFFFFYIILWPGSWEKKHKCSSELCRTKQAEIDGKCDCRGFFFRVRTSAQCMKVSAFWWRTLVCKRRTKVKKNERKKLCLSQSSWTENNRCTAVPAKSSKWKRSMTKWSQHKLYFNSMTLEKYHFQRNVFLLNMMHKTVMFPSGLRLRWWWGYLTKERAREKAQSVVPKIKGTITLEHGHRRYGWDETRWAAGVNRQSCPSPRRNCVQLLSTGGAFWTEIFIVNTTLTGLRNCKRAEHRSRKPHN